MLAKNCGQILEEYVDLSSSLNPAYTYILCKWTNKQNNVTLNNCHEYFWKMIAFETTHIWGGNVFICLLFQIYLLGCEKFLYSYILILSAWQKAVSVKDIKISLN